MHTKFLENGRLLEFSFYCLAAYFCSTTFTHALSQIFLGGACFFYLSDMFFNKRFSIKPKIDLFPLFILLFLGWSIISALAGPTPLMSLVITREEWLFLMIPTAAVVLSDDKNRRISLRIFAVSIILMSLYAVIQHFVGEHFYHGERLSPAPGGGWRVAGSFSHYLTFGNYYAMASVFMLGLAGGMKEKMERLLFYCGFTLSAVATLLTFSYGPIVSLFLGLLIYLIFFGRRNLKLLVPLLLIVGMITVGLAPKVMSRLVHTIKMESMGVYPGSRMAIWKTAARMIPEHPVFGVGQGNFLKEYESYREPKSDKAFSHAHNDILNIAAYAGIPGAVFYIGFWAVIIGMMTKSVRRAPRRNDEHRAIVTACLLFSAVFFMTSLYEASFTDEEVRLLLMAVWGLFLGVEMKLELKRGQ